MILKNINQDETESIVIGLCLQVWFMVPVVQIRNILLVNAQDEVKTWLLEGKAASVVVMET